MEKKRKYKKRALVGLSPRLLSTSFGARRSGQAGGVKKLRVLVGLSGGVDSSVAAALLKEQGYDVVGVFMRFWKDPSTGSGQAGQNACCSAESEAAARLVAGKLGIPFYVFDFSREFKKEVVDYFLRELAAGRTPNPCVVCNPQIKFGLFLARARKLGADFVATGHYARLWREIPISKSQFSNKLQDKKIRKVKLYQAKDKQKDQSYFLHGLTQEQLSRVLFPLANYTKAEVYKLADKRHLPHQAHQSFDVCFIEDYKKFLGKYLKMKAGEIRKIYNAPPRYAEGFGEASHPPLKLRGGEGELLGMHQGLPLYTLGQRASVGGPGPFYVVKKDVKKNILYVSNNEKDLLCKEMGVEKVNWVAGQAPKLPLKCKVKIRYQAEAAQALIAKRKSRIAVEFSKPQRAITPGQSAVFYGRNGEVLGGGLIA